MCHSNCDTFVLCQLAMRGAAGPMGMTGLPGRVVSWCVHLCVLCACLCGCCDSLRDGLIYEYV